MAHQAFAVHHLRHVDPHLAPTSRVSACQRYVRSASTYHGHGSGEYRTGNRIRGSEQGVRKHGEHHRHGGANKLPDKLGTRRRPEQVSSLQVLHEIASLLCTCKGKVHV